MTVSSMPYDVGTYSHYQFATMMLSLIRDGYVKNYGSELLVSASTGLTVSVGSGRARVRGYWYKNPAAKSLTIGTADPTYTRIDRIVVRMDLTAAPRKIRLAVLPGIPAGSPVAPTLTRTATVYEISLAQVGVAAAATTLTAGDITDERDDYTVCGVAAIASAAFGNLLTPTAAVDMGGQKITDLPAPSASGDIARKAYYDSVIGSALGANKFEIVPFYGTVPTGWLECNGQAVDQATYPGLWAAWGTTFGTSAGKVVLPDLRGRLVYGCNTTPASTGGEKTVTLNIAKMGPHTHSGAYPGAAISVFTTNTGSGPYYGGSIATPVDTTSTGSGAAHNNLSPYLTIRFMVRGS